MSAMGSSSPFCIRCATILLFWPLCRPCAHGLARTGQESAQAKSLAEGPIYALNPAEKPQGGLLGPVPTPEAHWASF